MVEKTQSNESNLYCPRCNRTFLSASAYAEHLPCEEFERLRTLSVIFFQANSYRRLEFVIKLKLKPHAGPDLPK